MSRGKTIQIYLPDGNPRGIKVCENISSPFSAIFVPRGMIKEASIYNELKKKSSIYFLFNEKDDLSKFKTYVGETEGIEERFNNHKYKKDFWDYAVFFISEKKLNKAHIRFLEAFCYKKMVEFDRTEIMNSQTPKESPLSPSDKDFALDLFEEMKLILDFLGYPVFNKIRNRKIKEEIFYCQEKEAKAEGALTEDGFIVFSGSIAKKNEAKSGGSWVLNMRERLKESNILIKKGNDLIFSKDFVFGSPSSAAVAVLARRANGWTEWKTKGKKTLDELKRKIVK